MSERLDEALECSGLSPVDCRRVIHEALRDFFMVLRDPSCYEKPVLLARKIERLFARTVGIFSEYAYLTETTCLPVIREKIALIFSEELATSSDYEAVLVTTFACHEVSADSVYSLLTAICILATNKTKFLDEHLLLAKSFVNGFYSKEYFPEEFMKMVEIAALTITSTEFIAKNPSPLQACRLIVIARWFQPWYGMVFLMPVQDHKSRKGFALKGKDFIEGFKILYAAAMKKWDFDNREDRLSMDDISVLKKSVLAMIRKTEFDTDLMSVIFAEHSEDLLENRARDLLLYLINDELELTLKLTHPKVKSLNLLFPDPTEYRHYSGRCPDLYPKWRDFAIRNLLNSKIEDTVTHIFTLLQQPLSAELDLALENCKKKSKARKSSANTKPSKKLYDIFIYSDAQFKFKPEKDWLNSDRHRNIQILISGISGDNDKNVANLASTWKSQSFEEFLSIVALY
jgi:hypothetical protein